MKIRLWPMESYFKRYFKYSYWDLSEAFHFDLRFALCDFFYTCAMNKNSFNVSRFFLLIWIIFIFFGAKNGFFIAIPVTYSSIVGGAC